MIEFYLFGGLVMNRQTDIADCRVAFAFHKLRIHVCLSPVLQINENLSSRDGDGVESVLRGLQG